MNIVEIVFDFSELGTKLDHCKPPSSLRCEKVGWGYGEFFAARILALLLGTATLVALGIGFGCEVTVGCL